MMQQASPQQPQSQGSNPSIGVNHPTPPGPPMHLGMPSQQTEKLDNISKVKSLIVPLRESLAVNTKSNHSNQFTNFNSIQMNLSSNADDIENGRTIAATQ